MSELAIRDALLAQTIATLDPLIGDGLAYENKDFDPDDLPIWCSFHFAPATSESLGKTKASSDDERGFIQISVYVKSNALNYDTEQIKLIDSIKKDFYYGVKIADVDILEVTTNSGYKVESWYKRDLTINYSSYQPRG